MKSPKDNWSVPNDAPQAPMTNDAAPRPMTNDHGAPRSHRRPFTLVELLTVLVIIMVLAGLLVGGVGIARRKSIDAKCRSEIHILEVALEQYRQEFGYYPQSSAVPTRITDWFIMGRYVGSVRYHGLEKPSGTTDPGKYFLMPETFTFQENGTIPRDCFDPFSHAGRYIPPKLPYYYQCPGRMNPQTYDLWSAGQDGWFGVPPDPLPPPPPTPPDPPNPPQNSQLADTATQNCDDITNWKRN